MGRGVKPGRSGPRTPPSRGRFPPRGRDLGGPGPPEGGSGAETHHGARPGRRGPLRGERGSWGDRGAWPAIH